MQILELLKQRRVWASIAALLAIALPLAGYTDFSADSLVEAIMTVINGISAVAAIILPIWSYLKPKSN